MPESVCDTIISFLQATGIAVEQRQIEGATVLPGITVDGGALVIDRTKLAHPGDILHEAGHLAVVPKAERDQLTNNVGTDAGLEMGAIAWSYAAAVHLGLSAEVVFHDDGYKGGASSLRENFAGGRYIGVPILSWRGLAENPKPGAAASPADYPLMKKWLCD